MNARYDVISIMDYLRNQPDINPDEYDGSYELLRETVRSYTAIKDDPMLDYHDLNALYFMVVGTWKHGIDRKKAVIQESHLPEAEKSRLLSVINRIWERVCAREYIHLRDSDPPRMGMFGTGFMTFKGKAPDQCASAFVRVCAEIFPLADEDDIFRRVEQVLTHGFRGMQAASVSVILHCMKPDVFPILNGNMGTDNIFDTLGLRLNKRGEALTYIANCRIIRAFRDQNFTFRNYRVFDTAQHAMTQFAISEKSAQNTAEKAHREEIASIATIANDSQLGSEPKQITERILSELTGSDDAIRYESHATQTSVYYRNAIFARIFYRANAIRVEMFDNPAVHALYDELQAESIAYQKPSADPYSTLGKYSFFVRMQDVEAALMAIMISVQDGNLISDTVQTRRSRPHVLPAAETKSKTSRAIEDLKRLGYDDLRELFIQWCKDSGLSPSAYMTFVSDCFYLWRKEDPAQFWLAVESDDTVMNSILYQSLRKNSSGNTDKNAPGYARAIRRFRAFVASWMKNKEVDVSNKTASTALQNTTQPSNGLAVSGREVLPENHGRYVAPVRTPEISSRLEKKLDSIIGAIATIYSEKSSTAVTDVTVTEETDRRFRIEATLGDAPVLMLKTRPAITGLIFTLKLCAVGIETSAERYQIFFANKNAEPMSEPQEIEAVAGEEYTCRFELRSSASEEKIVYLVVRSGNAAPDEVRQLIEIPVKIAFAADFGL